MLYGALAGGYSLQRIRVRRRGNTVLKMAVGVAPLLQRIRTSIDAAIAEGKSWSHLHI